MAGPVGPPSFPPLDTSLGAIEIGGVVSTFLFGIVTLQAYYYFRQFEDDSRYLKATVFMIWLLELGHTVSIWHAIYSVTVTFFGRPQHISSPPRSLEISIFFSIPITFFVQCFFANRIRVLSGKWFLTCVCWLLTFLRCVGLFGVFGVALNLKSLADFSHFKWLVGTTVSLGLTADIIIAASLSYYLSTMREKSIQQTRLMVDTLILWALETGAATSGTSLGLVIFFFVGKDLTWFPFYLVLAKVLSNCMLASLNGRQRFRAANKPPITFDTTLTPSTRAHGVTSGEHRVMDFEMSGMDLNGEEFVTRKVEAV
ncbi:unnamed protein product [Mycena citricolor]|uniref:DUF6534 domain-containing protein n=1 Tax=Mycena citricolor TaxID=2018698 RepID=A0AAD2H2A9_9AGAR|nr:unnamed protein product [Mycena citricolor]CAK5273421.1 unnamed protein product [Mycena citricolor]